MAKTKQIHMSQGSATSSADGFITVDVHHRGIFIVGPTKFVDGDLITVTDVNFGSMSYSDFRLYMKALLGDPCHYIYFCIPKRTLSKGLVRIKSDVDYQLFLKNAYHVGKISIYVDVFCQDMSNHVVDVELLDASSEGEMSDGGVSDDHEEEDDVINIRSKYDDHFCTELFVDREGTEFARTDEPDDVVYPTHDPNIPWRDMEPVVGMKFTDPKQLKECLTNYAVAQGYALWYEKTDCKRMLVRCGDRNSKTQCSFRLWATWMTNGNAFQIKTLNPNHNCSRNLHLGSLVTYNWIANKYAKEIVDNPDISIRALQKDIKEKYNLKASVSQCQRAKKTALGEIESKLRAHYALLWSYAEELRRANPGSTIKLDVISMPDGKNYFNRFYICLNGIKQAWIQGCRKVIGIDGAFLKGVCTGELIAAVGRDANNQMFPLAWAVVSIENKDSWTWFLDLLIEDIGCPQGTGITILSDGHKGLREAVRDICPNAEHRVCGRHIYANFSKRFKGPHFKDMFWDAAKSSTPQEFKIAMDKIKRINPLAHSYLMDREPKCWSRAFFEVGRQCAAVENGICESFNGVIVHARRKPIITMLEEIRLYVMERMTLKREKGNRMVGNICPKIQKKFDTVKEYHRFWDVVPSGFFKFEVRNGKQAFSVDINERICSCRIWQLKGTPCVHGVAALANLNKDPDLYISTCFTKEVYLRTYEHNINPLNGQEMWPQVSYIPPLPPKHRRMPGRPATKRKKHQSELDEQKQKHSVSKKGSIMTCSLCKARGHNKTRCPTKQKEEVGRDGANQEQRDEGNQEHRDEVQKAEGNQSQTNEGTSKPQPKPKRKKQRLPQLLLESEEETDLGREDEVVQAEVPPVHEHNVPEPDLGREDEVVGQPPLIRRRKPSERILKMKIRRGVKAGEDGCSSGQPVNLE